MIIVTGTKRSGTSMWMQILIAAGFPPIGDAFPGVWGKTIRGANPAGFYESRLRQGVYFATNPDPATGKFLMPKNVRRNVIKIFIPGLVRTDYAYIGPVIATMREWREYCTSLHRLHDMEDTYKEEARARGEEVPDGPFPDEATMLRVRAGKIPPALEWWFEMYDLIRDVVTRRYQFHMTTYQRLLDDPEREVGKVIDWLGEGDKAAAIAAVKPELRTQSAVDYHDPLVAELEPIFDELYHAVHVTQKLSTGLIEKLNETNGILTKRWEEVFNDRLKALKEGVAER